MSSFVNQCSSTLSSIANSFELVSVYEITSHVLAVGLMYSST